MFSADTKNEIFDTASMCWIEAPQATKLLNLLENAKDLDTVQTLVAQLRGVAYDIENEDLRLAIDIAISAVFADLGERDPRAENDEDIIEDDHHEDVDHDLEHRLNFASAEEILHSFQAGNATITIRNAETGNRFTYKFERLKETKRKFDGEDTLIFISVLRGSDNTSNYGFVGTFRISPQGMMKYNHSPKGIKESAQSARVISWVFNRLFTKTLPSFIEFYHAGNCLRCGRLLTVPESILSGYGPECAKHRFM